MDHTSPKGEAPNPAKTRNNETFVAKRPPAPEPKPEPKPVRETGGPKGPEPTRYGDWERNGRCIDF